jgi:hypothetical protein
MRGSNSVLALLVIGFMFCGGCGGDPGPTLHPVKGKLTRGGKPLANVLVTFTPTEKGISSTGMTNSAGEFVLVTHTGKSGAIAGKHKVTLSARDSSASVQAGGPDNFKKMIADREASTKNSATGAPVAVEKSNADETIPPEYGTDKTPLQTYEVKAENNDFDIAIP